MTRHPALGSFAVASLSIATLVFFVGAAVASNAVHASSPGPAGIGESPPQVALTVSYSVVGGGGGSQAQDLLTYVDNGAQQVVALTGSPTVYMVDSGTQWSAQTILNGSSATERWITTQDVSGTVAAPLTVALSYYHQYRTTFSFDVTNGGAAFSGPPVSFDELGGIVTVPAPAAVWVDASSAYAYGPLLPGSSPTERWILVKGGTGTISGPGTVLVTYNHEFLVSSSYSVVGGGDPAPSLSGQILGSPTTIRMTTSTQSVWFDSGAAYSFSSLVAAGTGERWVGTVLVKTQSGSSLSMDNNGTVTGAVSVTPVYYHQFLVTVAFNFLGGSTTGLTLPSLSYQSFGAGGSASDGSAVWVDGGTQYARPETFCCIVYPNYERWQLNNSTTGTITSATEISSTYFHQYYESFQYSVVGRQPPSPSGQPVLTYIVEGSAQQLAVLQTSQDAWADANARYSVTPTLPGSGSLERWFATTAAGTISGPASQFPVDVVYNQQYLLTIVGGGLPTQWVNAGDATLNTPTLFGRSQGTGFRAISYQVDDGPVSTLPQPVAALTIPFFMDGPHTITFQSVRQFQVSLDAGAAGAISSITPPTVPGDNYWYDTESHVQLTLSGGFGRANGVGQRLTSIVATGQPTRQVNTVGTVLAYTNNAIETPISITTTSVTQYEVVLNGPASAALVSIAPPSTFPNDTFWYDSGAPPVTVVLNAVYSRSAGTGIRITSWEMDSGPSTMIASTGTITVTTKGMSSPHFLNATSVTQYQVTIDKGGASALASISNTPIPLDTGWYDASGPVGLAMNGAWGRASGSGQRLASYSINGGPQVAVATGGLVIVLNVTKLASPESVATTIVTQYQVTLDTSSTAALASMTSTPIANDNYWFDSGTPVSVSLNGVWARSQSSGTRLLSYSVNQGAPTAVLSSGPVQVLSLSGISSSQSVITKTGVQYHLTSSPVAWTSITESSLPGDAAGWFDSGTAVKAVYNASWGITSTGSRSSVTSYSLDGGTKTNVPRSGTGTFIVVLTMSSAHSIGLNSVTQYLLAVAGPAKVNATTPSQTGDEYFDSGTKVGFTLPEVWSPSSKIGARELLASYSLDGGAPILVKPAAGQPTYTIPPVTFTKPHFLIVSAVAQYRVAFQFLDGSSKNALQPSDVQLAVGNSTVDVQGRYTWLANGTSFRVVNVMWEGTGVGPTPAPSFNVASPLNVTLNTRVYPASLKVVDLLGLPVSGAQVSMTLANGTTVTGTTNGDGTFAAGMVPLGAFTAKVSNLGTGAQIVGDASSDQQTAQGKVPLSLVSLIGVVSLVSVAGAGGFLFRRRKKKAAGGGAKPAK